MNSCEGATRAHFCWDEKVRILWHSFSTFAPRRMLPSHCLRVLWLKVECPWVNQWPLSPCHNLTCPKTVTWETTWTWSLRQTPCCPRIPPTRERGEVTWTPFQTTPSQTMPPNTEVSASRLIRGLVATLAAVAKATGMVTPCWSHTLSMPRTEGCGTRF